MAVQGFPHTETLYLLLMVVDGGGLCGRLRLEAPFELGTARLGDDMRACTVDGGVELPYTELKVEEDAASWFVPFEESLDDLSVRKLALERRLKSLKNGIVCARARKPLRNVNGNGFYSPRSECQRPQQPHERAKGRKRQR